uniref:Uncharacterized protein n=1 Tax=uncultured marine virus TaxID=186617 RepID=A0A0F7L994_9VIRU|nr:hypothetical protein [uncultured marine virus]
MRRSSRLPGPLSWREQLRGHTTRRKATPGERSSRRAHRQRTAASSSGCGRGPP